MKKDEYRVLFTSESVSEGHPDKLCDRISDAILDECLRLDPNAHVACETLATEECIVIGGQITCNGNVDYEKIARETMREVGYTSPELGIGCDTCKVEIKINKQSPDINQGVDRGDRTLQGAGDQGIMFGYATNETEGYMPLALSIAHKLVRFVTNLRKEGKLPGARPDMKSQVTIDYTNPEKPTIDTVVMAVQHDEDANLREIVKELVVDPVIRSFGFDGYKKLFFNETGKFVIGGPQGDAGLTGRKIIVDTYGGSARHGGGAFSGKDPSKVDRSAAYYARYMAKNLVAAGAADRLEIQLSYAIGVAEPVSINILTYGTKHEGITDELIFEAVENFFDARPGSIIEQFSLTTPSFKYEDTANYGAFGRPDLDLPWEKLDKVEELTKFFTENK